MAAQKRPGAHDSDRAGETVLGGTALHNIATPEQQRRADPPCRIVGWRINRWLTVENVEVGHG